MAVVRDELKSFRSRRNLILKARMHGISRQRRKEMSKTTVVEPTTIEDLELQNKFKKFVVNSTKLFSKQFESPAEKIKLSDKAKKITGLMNDQNRDFGCGRKNVADIISLIIGEPIIITVDDRYFERRAGACIVPLDNENGHNYKVGDPILYYSDSSDCCLKMNGQKGNHPGNSKRNLRPATEAEIETFVEKFPVNKIRIHFSFLEAMA